MDDYVVAWYNPNKNVYDNFYTPKNYYTPFKAKIVNGSKCIDTVMSVSQWDIYIKGYDLVDNIFTDTELKDWLKCSNTVNYSKYKDIVAKVEIT